MAEGRDDKDNFPYDGGAIERMKFKYPDITIEPIKIEITPEHIIEVLEDFWNKMEQNGSSKG